MESNFIKVTDGVLIALLAMVCMMGISKMSEAQQSPCPLPQVQYVFHPDDYWQMHDNEPGTPGGIKEFTVPVGKRLLLTYVNSSQNIWFDIQDPHGTSVVDSSLFAQRWPIAEDRPPIIVTEGYKVRSNHVGGLNGNSAQNMYGYLVDAP